MVNSLTTDPPAWNLPFFTKKIDEYKGKRTYISDTIKDLETEIEGEKVRYSDCVTAGTILKENAQATQSELERQVSVVVTPAITSILGKPYKFRMAFEQRRNNSECDIYLEDADGNEYDVLNDNGGGLVDIVSIALRIACWRMSVPRPAGIFVMDEPARNLSKVYIANMSFFLKEVSERLGVQFIMVTHSDEIIEAADKIIEIG